MSEQDDRPMVGAVYEHYKGGLYTVEGFAVHHDTRETMVLYRSHLLGVVNARPLYGTERDPDGWLTPVDGKPRFERAALSCRSKC